MNRFLAETLSVLNGVIAILIVFGGAYLGYKSPYSSLFTVLIGAALGVIVAALACGIISYLALIEGHLAKISGGRGSPDVSENPRARREPSL